VAIGNFIQLLVDLRLKEKTAALSVAERRDLEEAKERFARSVCASQNLLLRAGDRPRSAFRVSVLFAVEINLDASTGPSEQTITLDVSRGGFSTLLSHVPAVSSEGSFTMALTSGDAVWGRAVVVGVTEKKRVSFAFRDLAQPDEARLEDALFDAILPRFL
jgi:hypothetical protein